MLMAKKKASKPETKSDFLRRVLGRNPNLEYRQVNQRWAKAGHPGEISNPLYYLIRRELGIKTEWVWAKADDVHTAKPAKAIQPTEVYQIKITLKASSPPIWRRIQVGDCTLDKLHEHIQTSMGWTNSHLNHFVLEETLYGDPLLLQGNFYDMQYRDSTKTTLSDILPKDGRRFAFEYEYDLGDSWMHEILFEGRLTADPAVKYPICLEGERACPPEDVGGVWGYADFLKAISDPEAEDHEDLLRWAGGKFDPEAFNPQTSSKRMKKGLPDWRRMM
jgi:Plasmid pRiA4b ORF-3-like protein